MGSAAMVEAIHAIRDFSVTKGTEPAEPHTSGVFGNLVFNETEQEKRLPEGRLSRLATDDYAR